MMHTAIQRLRERSDLIRTRLGRPLTWAEKILFGHLDDPDNADLTPGKSILSLRVDRVAMQDATAQMALLQFAQAGLPRSAVPATIHCDHLVTACAGAETDVPAARQQHGEVYDFLASAAARFGLGFWEPGSGIIHQIVLEHYAFPGGLMIGTDSHTPNAGGLGMAAIGVGGADAVDAMAGLPWEVLHPHVVGVRLTGKLSGWAAPKDVILELLRRLTVKGGTNRIIEYFGPGAETISCSGKATITNMGAELGATCSLFPFDRRMAGFLRSTGREADAKLAEENADLLRADDGAEKAYQEIIDIDLSTIEPMLAGPHTPDRVRTAGAMGAEVEKEKMPEKVSAVLIGSCTNSSYEDFARIRTLAKKARAEGRKAAVPLLVAPGSERVRLTLERDGLLEDLRAVGAQILSSACGPCIGQWKRDPAVEGPNVILTTFNRNFPARNDGNPDTLAFLCSPETATAYALTGDFTGNPFPAPSEEATPDLPPGGFITTSDGFIAPPETGDGVDLVVSPKSERLQLLSPFPAWDGKDFENLPLLIKAKGKCTTDHISPAGPWLRFRGHLDRISDNLLTGAVNAFTGKTGTTKNLLNGETGRSVPETARAYREAGKRWVIVGDENYGEGSSREHAAMEPRHLGGAAVIVRSFARIHQSNLKKQGILPLVFSDAADYDRILEEDRISLTGLKDLAPGRSVEAVIHHADGSEEKIILDHTLTEEQVAWFRAGSALNRIREEMTRAE